MEQGVGHGGVVRGMGQREFGVREQEGDINRNGTGGEP